MHKKLILIAVLLTAAGCASNSPEELDRLVKEDLNFKQMVLARDEAHHHIQAIKEDLLNRKKVMDSQIEKVRKEYDGYAKNQNLKIEKYKSTVEANRNALKHEIETKEAQLAARLTELGGYQKTLDDVKKVMSESKGISISAQEKEKWDERMMMLSEKIRPLSEEIQELKLQIRSKKQKIGYLQ